MDLTLMLNLATLVISLVALGVSVYLTLRQIRLSSGGNHLPVVMEAFKETRSDAFFEAQEYILTELTEHAVGCGYRGLPEPARGRVKDVGVFFDDLGKLVAYGVIDQSLIIGSYGRTIVRLWDALAPYVYAERRAHHMHIWIYFEDLAARTAAMPPEVVYAALGLRPRPPAPDGPVGPGPG